MTSGYETKFNKYNSNSVKMTCRAVPWHHVARDMLHVKVSDVFTHDMSMVAPWPDQCVIYRRFTAQ